MRNRGLVCTSTSCLVSIRASVYKGGCGVRGLRVRGECEVGQRRWNGRVGGCRRPCKNKELIFFLLRVKVSIGGRDSFATRLFLRRLELMDVFGCRSIFQGSGKLPYEKVYFANVKEKKEGERLNSMYPIKDASALIIVFLTS